LIQAAEEVNRKKRFWEKRYSKTNKSKKLKSFKSIYLKTSFNNNEMSS